MRMILFGLVPERATKGPVMAVVSEVRLITGGRVEKPPIPKVLAKELLDRRSPCLMQAEMKNAPPHYRKLWWVLQSAMGIVFLP